MFNIIAKDNKTSARSGIIEVGHRRAETPAYVIVGTNAEVRTLKEEDLKATGTQMVIANAYHLWQELGEGLDNFEGVHKKMNWDGIIMTDSGGFQVFSLGFGREHKIGKVAPIFPENYQEKKQGWLNRFFSRERKNNLVKVMRRGVNFWYGGEKHFLGPELSIQIQEKLGSDIILAFDECTSPFHNYKYTKKALKRTHAWAIKCLEAKKRKDQKIFGIVQGGGFED